MLPISLSDPVHPQSGSNLMKKNYWAGMGALTVLQQKEEGWHTLLLLHVQLEVQGFSFVMQALQL